MNKYLIVSLMALTLSACVNWEERDNLACISYGAVKGTSEYISCRSRLEAGRRSKPIIYNAAPIKYY